MRTLMGLVAVLAVVGCKEKKTAPVQTKTAATPAPTQAKPQAASEAPPIELTAAELFYEYADAADKDAVDDRLRKKPLRVSGIIFDTGTDIANDAYAEFRAPHGTKLQLRFQDDSSVARLQKDQIVVVLCHDVDRGIGAPVLKGCVIDASPPKIVPPVEVTAEQLFDAYKTDESGADQKFKAKTLRVRGKIDEVLVGRHLFLATSSKDGVTVQAEFANKDVLRTLKPGQQITALCRGAGAVYTAPLLNECMLVE